MLYLNTDKIPVEPRKGGETVVGAGLAGLAAVAAADLGGSVLTGTLGNPLGLLERKLSYTLHKVRDQCPLYRANGNPVDEYLDTKVEVAYNSLFNKANKLRKEIFSGLEAQIHNHYPVWRRAKVARYYVSSNIPSRLSGSVASAKVFSHPEKQVKKGIHEEAETLNKKKKKERRS
ncbi:hypothetical protein KY285_006276 [Solanum tuberosum]|nr:hypothetical protein KY285_006276 [Solanum tuberosum]